jgi:hypothetical protein
MPERKKTSRLKQAFNATLFSLGLACTASGTIAVAEGFTAATTQDFDNARACDAHVAGHKACTAEEVDSLRNIRTSFQHDAMGFSLLMGGGLFFLKRSENESKDRRRNDKPPRP